MKKRSFVAFKISLAAIAAILVADALNLQFYVSAGIVAVLSVAGTKKETMKTAASRFVAFLAALLIAAVCFAFLGVTITAFCVYLIFFILVCQIFQWNSAMAMDSVLISHFLSMGQMDYPGILNELLLFAIGVGMGILVNLSLRKNLPYMEQMKTETDEQIKVALHRMAERIMDADYPDYDGSCFLKLRKSVSLALAVAQENYMNQFGQEDTEDIAYITMRANQIEVLHEMYKKVVTLQTKPVTAKALSDFLKKMAESYSEDNTVEGLLAEFYEMRAAMKKEILPADREEFEERAQLYGLMGNIEEFLKIKREYAIGLEKTIEKKS